MVCILKMERLTAVAGEMNRSAQELNKFMNQIFIKLNIYLSHLFNGHGCSNKYLLYLDKVADDLNTHFAIRNEMHHRRKMLRLRKQLEKKN